MSEQAQAFGQVSGAELTTAAVVDRLSRFDGPPEEFLVNLLAVQCHLASAEAGVVLRSDGQGGAELLAVWPQLPAGAAAPTWMSQAVESCSQVISAGKTAIKPMHDREDMYGQAAKRQMVMLPIGSGGGNVRGLAAFVIGSGDPKALVQCRERLELSMSLLSLYEMRLTLQRRQFNLRRLNLAMETLSAVNEQQRSAGASMALCNEVAARWNCDRVGLGFLKGRSVKLKALSHTEKIVRKMQLVQEIEATMEECLDQDVEVVHPAPEDATYVSRAAAELSTSQGPATILSLPLRRGGKVVGAITAERPSDGSFELDEVESLRLTAELCTARLHELSESDRWFGAKAAAAVRKGCAHALGAKHTWAKVAVLLGFLAIVFLVFGQGNFRASGTFVLEAQQSRLVPAPFDGYIEAVYVQPGSKVIAGQTVLGKLETVRLESELGRKYADLAGARKQADQALNEGKIVESQIADAEAQKAEVEIRELKREIAEASIISPISGTVVSPDLTRQIRGHMSIGDPMFEVAPIESLRAELWIQEDEIADVVIAYTRAQEEGKELAGELATESKPGQHVGFVVERINPVAEVEKQDNVFKVRVRLAEVRGGMLPGAKGVAKIDLGKRSYAFIWTRKLVNWVRMKLWL